MEANSFTSSSNYFDRLRSKTRELDGGIEQLTKTWKTPHLLIGGYAERTAETDACLKKLQDSIQSVGDEVKKLQLELEPSLDETDKLLLESQAMYEDLKEQCDNLDIVLGEYGYRYEESNDGSENHSRNDSQDRTNNSLLTNEEIPDMEVEFTPNLTWKCKAKSDSLTRTPVIRNLESVLQSEILNKNSNEKGSFTRDFSVQKSNYSRKTTKKNY